MGSNLEVNVFPVLHCSLAMIFTYCRYRFCSELIQFLNNNLNLIWDIPLKDIDNFAKI
jgi:hypothetical protein